MTDSFDLTFERIVPVPASFLWKGWTDPQVLVKWFTPHPWTTRTCRIVLEAGGEFYVEMVSPDGQVLKQAGCYLKIVPEEKLIWTNTLKSGFAPAALSSDSPASFPFTAHLDLSPAPTGTHYQATVVHADEAGYRQHLAMGFHTGWGLALDQLVALYNT
ncbi:MAG: SRPBCC domain-containing protein [Proteobacteria bacterium]|nr:SRPBCC domain-containing protein [Pseudomonadota bacterium]